MCCSRALCTRISSGCFVFMSSTAQCERLGFKSRRGPFSPSLHCLEPWSWKLQRPHLKAGSFAVM
eukprot:2055665-Prymnesium_polylepis.1